MKRLTGYLVGVFIGMLTRTLVAAPPAYDINAVVDADTVGVGEVVQLVVRVSSGGDPIEDPQPGATPGFRVTGSRMEPNESITIINGAVSRKRGLVATFALQATAPGAYTLGPASVKLGNQRVTASPVKVRVVPAGQAPPRRPPPNRGGFGMPFSPFDPWRDIFGSDDPSPPAPPMPAIPLDPRLALPGPRNDTAFIHATLDKYDAVVGEQVTLSVNLYVDPRRAPLSVTDPHDAATADFLRRPLMEEQASLKKLGYAEFGGSIWEVISYQKIALFPVKAGDLTVGPMSITFVRQNTPLPPRLSETLTVHVREPPLPGRPPGYAVGDVGKYDLSVTVDPREVEEEGGVAVEVQLSGVGNLPSSLRPPSHDGLEWLEGQKKEKLSVMGGDKWGGSRTFSYIVKPHRAGTINLGDWTLPYWNPETRRYAVARASLGTIVVSPRPKQESANEEKNPPPDPFAGMPPLREHMGAAAPSRKALSDSRFYWLALFGAPLIYFLVVGANGALGRWTRWRGAREASPANELKGRLLAAEEALNQGDARGVDVSIARALEAAARAYMAINVRGAGSHEFTNALRQANVDPEVAGRVEVLLAAGEAARFAQEEVDPPRLRSRLDEARALVRALKGAA